jgi:DNA-binding transcriptional MerR regulator
MPSTPAQVAKLIGISVQGVRDWTKQYAPILSPTARGENGARLFDDTDLHTMQTIASLRQTGLRAEEIIRRVQDGDVPPIVDITPEPPQTSPTEHNENPQVAPETALALQMAQTTLSAMLARMDAMERRQEAQVSEGRTRAGMFALGVIVGVFLVLILVIIANYLSVIGG